MLISGTHFTEKYYLKLPTLTVYHTTHPAGTARGGTAIIIKNSLKHHQINNYSKISLQATNVLIVGSTGPLTISAVYFRPRYAVEQEQFEEFFNAPGQRFIAGAYNAKHIDWGSRLVKPKGRELFKTVESNNLKHLSTGEPTYWPNDMNKLPDLVNFCVTKVAKSCFDLSSDHSQF
jgi:hypothetical protein